MNPYSAAETVLKANKGAFIRWELADDASMGRKAEYVAIYSKEGNELLQINRKTINEFTREGVVKAGRFDPKHRTYCFRQEAA